MCVGFTSGVIQWAQSRTSMQQVWAGIPDLRSSPSTSSATGAPNGGIAILLTEPAAYLDTAVIWRTSESAPAVLAFQGIASAVFRGLGGRGHCSPRPPNRSGTVPRGVREYASGSSNGQALTKV